MNIHLDPRNYKFVKYFGARYHVNGLSIVISCHTLQVSNTVKTNSIIRIFNTRVKLIQVASLCILFIQWLVVCLTFEVLFTKISDFFFI